MCALILPQMKQPPHDLIVESPSYKVLLEHTSKLEHTISEAGDELPRLKDEVVQLRSTRKEWEESVLVRPPFCLLMYLGLTSSHVPGCNGNIERRVTGPVRSQGG